MGVGESVTINTDVTDCVVVKDKFNSLFTAMKFESENIDSEDLKVFDYVDDETLNLLYTMKHGNKPLNATGKQITIENMAKILIRVYGKKWDDCLLTYINSLEELREYNETIYETISNEGVISLNRDNTNRVSAYNDDELVDKTGDSGSENSETLNSKVREYDVKRVKDVRHYRNLLSYLNKFDICDIIFTDINSLVTLMVY